MLKQLVHIMHMRVFQLSLGIFLLGVVVSRFFMDEFIIPPLHDKFNRKGDKSQPAYVDSSSQYTWLQGKDGMKPKIHFVTVATKESLGLSIHLFTSNLFHIETKVLGMGDPRFQEWGVGFGVKLELFQNYLQTQCDQDDIFFFSDAYDTYHIASQEEVLFRASIAINRALSNPQLSSKSDKRIPSVIFAAEMFPTVYLLPPHEVPSNLAIFNDVPQSYHFKYLNSGGFIGSAKDLITLMNALPYSVNTDDQHYFTLLYNKSKSDLDLPRVIVDHENDLFLTFAGQSILEDLKYDVQMRQFKHRLTKGHPVMLHDAGHPKVIFLYFFTLHSLHVIPSAFIYGVSITLILIYVVEWVLKRYGFSSSRDQKSTKVRIPGFAV
jgi:hypothetical protein